MGTSAWNPLRAWRDWTPSASPDPDMATPIAIAGLTFPTKGEAKKFFGTIRDRYDDGVRLSEEDHGLIRGLLACHPETKEKTGAGIAYFCIETDKEFGRTRHFVVHRVDGSSSDFSFHACIDGRNERRDRLEALRRAITPQIIAFRDRCFALQTRFSCPLRGVAITSDSYHVDHESPLDFHSLVDRWLGREELNLADVQITPPADNQVVALMTNPGQISSWCLFHEQHARLRLLSPRGNLSDAKRGFFC